MPNGWGSPFIHFLLAVLNYFKDEEDLIVGNTRWSGWFARFSQWLNRPSDAKTSA